MNKDLKVINLWAGPGTGKSTTAAGLFNLMKLQQYSVELVTEYAKQLVWEKQHPTTFDNQLLLLAKQDQKQRILVNQVNYCISDSPILMCLTYMPKDYYPSFKELTKEIFNSYENYNFFLRRVKSYDPRGRNQTYEEALVKDQEIKQILLDYQIDFDEVDADEHAHHKILEIIKRYEK
jgi:hypothetical protein